MTRLRNLACTAIVALAAGSAAAAPLDVPAARASVDQVLDRDYPRLDALYKDIHAHPELGYLETATAAKLAKQLKEIGFTVTQGVGKTGVVGVFSNGDGPTILVRTELDALPMEEKTGLPYASKARQMYKGREAPVAHSCGHDIHMAAWVGTARALVALKDRWRGTLVFVGQPSEETVDGAKAMLDDGLFTRFPKPDYGFALHVAPAPFGHVFYKPGAVSSTSDSLELVFQGRGGHGSRPSETLDPVLMASRFVVDVQSVVSREKDPAAFGVVTVGSVQAGSAGNIIPDSALLRGTVRSFEGEVRERLLDGIRRTAKAVALMAGAPEPQLQITPGGKAVINDAALTARTAEVFKAAFGPKAVVQPAPGSGSEDFSEFILAGVPSVFFGIGGLDPAAMAADAKAGKPLPSNHSPLFAPVPEPTIRTGVEAMTLAVMNVAQPAR